MTSADLIRETRLRSGLTQAELAGLTGTTQSVIARWEAGRSLLPFETLQRIVQACGLDLRIGLAEPDPDELSLIERNLSLTPEQRLEQLVRAVAFIAAGRQALADKRD